MAHGGLHAGTLDDVGDVHAAGARHLAAFAVQAQLQCLVKISGILHAVTLTIGAGLFGAGIVGGYSSYRTHGRANRALGALFKVVFAEVAQLHWFSHNIPLKNHQSNRYLYYLKSSLEENSFQVRWKLAILFAAQDVAGHGESRQQ
jgi:hypothetical protein